MPTIAQKRRKSTKSPKTKPSFLGFDLWGIIVALISGALLGLSAPGFNQWYLAWLMFAPLLLLSCQSKTTLTALIRGLAYGLAYNLVYLNWYLALHPLTWLGFTDWQSILLASASWMVVSAVQALIFALFALVVNKLPTTMSFLPVWADGRLCLPSLVVIPLLWVTLDNKLGNAHELLGVPWTMIEYSQYRQLPLLQATSIIGGIGLGFLVVMANTALAGLLASASKSASLQKLASNSLTKAWLQLLAVVLIVSLLYSWGLSKLYALKAGNTINLSILQGNINIEMQKTSHHFTLTELLGYYKAMAQKCPAGICVLAENALPAYMKDQSQATYDLGQFAKEHHLELYFGALDKNKKGQPFNSVFALTANGKLLPSVYHKRYLVPFGEYTPTFVNYLPEFLKRLTNTPAGDGFAAGIDPCPLSSRKGNIAPLLCFEIVSPEIVSESIRKGGQLIVNFSDLAWFHRSMIGDQMLAIAALRAAESKRYCVFAANSGPSAIIEPSGKILFTTPKCQKTLVSGKVEFISEITPFSSYYH